MNQEAQLAPGEQGPACASGMKPGTSLERVSVTISLIHELPVRRGKLKMLSFTQAVLPNGLGLYSNVRAYSSEIVV